MIWLLVRLLPPAAAFAAREGDLEGRVRVAVLPFDIPQDRRDINQLGAGMIDSLVSGLKYVTEIFMIDRWLIERVLREQKVWQSDLSDLKKVLLVGNLLKADVVITGSIHPSENHISLATCFFDTNSGETIVKEQLGGSNIFDVQLQLVELLVKTQGIAIIDEQKRRVESILKSTTDPSAYNCYLKGRKAQLLFTDAGNAEASRWYQKALRIDPDYELAYAGLEEILAVWGYQKFKQEDESYDFEYEQAIEFFHNVKASNPKLAAVQKTSASAGAGSEAFGRSHVAPATPKSESTDAETWYELWWASGNDKNPDHEYIHKALELDPDFGAARFDRGTALFRLQRFEEAVTDYEHAIRISPNDADAHVYLGDALARLQRYEEAEAKYRHAIRINAKDAGAHVGLGTMLVQRCQYDQAIAQYQTAMAVQPGYATTYNMLGDLLCQLKRYEEAVAEYRKALRINPTDAEAHYHLGVAYNEMGRWADCVKEWEETLYINPSHQEALASLPQARARLQG